MRETFGARPDSECDMKLLSVKDASEILGLSCALIYALCARKRIRHERHGLGRGTIKIPDDAIDEYRKSVTIGPQPAAIPSPPAPIKFKHLKI